MILRLQEYHSKLECEYLLYAEASAFRIGYEIEKVSEDTEFDTAGLIAYVEEESDGLIELITHVLPLDIRSDVIELMSRDKELLNLPVDDACGGHFTVSAREAAWPATLKRVRNRMGAVYAMWPHRLSSVFCGGSSMNVVRMLYIRDNWIPLGNGTAQPLRVRDDGNIECRVPDAVVNTQDLIERHLFFAAFFANLDKPWKDFKNAVAPYMTDEAVLLMDGFQSYINIGHVSKEVYPYVKDFTPWAFWKRLI